MAENNPANISFPLVSVIIPVFNGAKVIERCINSLLNQTYKNLEIIVVDDGSTDGTSALIKPPVKLFFTNGRCGAGAARNLGAKNASGEILFFTDADCVVPPNWIEKAITTMQEKNVLCGGGGYAGPLQNTFSQRFAFEELLWRRKNHKGYVRTLVSNNLYCSKKVFFEVGGFPENYRAASSEDMEFSWKVSEKYKIWWDEGNGVYHDFPNTISLYLKQQFRFARDAVPMLLGNTSIMKGSTHHGKSLYAEISFTAFALFAILFTQLKLALLALVLVLLINAEWLSFLKKERKADNIFIIMIIPTILLRNLTIIAGCIRGLLAYLKN